TVDDTQWGDIGVISHQSPSEQTFAYIDRVTRQNRIGNQYAASQHLAIELARDADILLIGAGAEPTCSGNCLLRGHARNIGILAGGADFTHHEDRAITVDFRADIGIAQITAAQFGCNEPLKLLGCLATRRNAADERESYIASLIDAIGVCEAWLLENSNAHAVAC